MISSSTCIQALCLQSNGTRKWSGAMAGAVEFKYTGLVSVGFRTVEFLSVEFLSVEFLSVDFLSVDFFSAAFFSPPHPISSQRPTHPLNRSEKFCASIRILINARSRPETLKSSISRITPNRVSLICSILAQNRPAITSVHGQISSPTHDRSFLSTVTHIRMILAASDIDRSKKHSSRSLRIMYVTVSQLTCTISIPFTRRYCR